MPTASDDHDLFLKLLETHRRPLLKVCWTYGFTPHDRDDLLQEILVRLWSAFGNYDRERPFLTWMFRVALNVAIDFRRQRRRWERDGPGLVTSQAADRPARSEDRELAEQFRELRQLLDRLPEDDRALLLLSLEGRSYREIGEILGISESNVGTRLNRLKHTLRQSPPTASGSMSEN